MNTNEFSEQFIDRIATMGRLFISPQDVGRLVIAFPVLGGGDGCIVLLVGDLVVRLVQHPGTWVAEHLVVAGSAG